MALPALLIPVANSALSLFNTVLSILKQYIVIIVIGSYLAPFLLYPLYVGTYTLNSAIAVGLGPFILGETASYLTGLMLFDIIVIILLSFSKFFKK